MKTVTQNELINNLLKIIGDIIKDNNGTPSGILYAGLMQYGCSLTTYNTIIDAFKRTGKIREINNLLYWNN